MVDAVTATSGLVGEAGSAETADGRTPARRPLRFVLAHFKAEAFVALAVVVTFLAIVYQDAFLSRNVVFSPADTSDYAISAYSDLIKTEDKGNSVIRASARRPLAWSCDVNDGYDYAFCAYEMLLERSGEADFAVVSDPQPLVAKT